MLILKCPQNSLNMRITNHTLCNLMCAKSFLANLRILIFNLNKGLPLRIHLKGLRQEMLPKAQPNKRRNKKKKLSHNIS